MKLDDLRGWMSGQDCVVVGCGPSAEEWFPLASDAVPPWTVACNRATQLVVYPDLAVCMESRKDPCWDVVLENQPLITFTHIENPPPRCIQIHSDLGQWMPNAPKNLSLAQSPFYAAAVAAWMGFERIGLIGADLSDEKRWPSVDFENEQWAALATVARDMGSELVQLSPESRLTAVPAGTWDSITTK